MIYNIKMSMDDRLLNFINEIFKIIGEEPIDKLTDFKNMGKKKFTTPETEKYYEENKDALFKGIKRFHYGLSYKTPHKVFNSMKLLLRVDGNYEMVGKRLSITTKIGGESFYRRGTYYTIIERDNTK